MMNDALRPTRGASQLGRAAKIAAAIADELGFRGDVDVKKLIESGFSWCRYLEPLPVNSTPRATPTLGGFAARPPYFFAGTRAGLLANSSFTLTLSNEVCALVANLCAQQTAAGTGTGRGVWEILDSAVSVLKTFFGAVASAAEYANNYAGPIWLPPGHMLRYTITYTGPGGAGNEITVNSGVMVYLFPAGVFPLC